MTTIEQLRDLCRTFYCHSCGQDESAKHTEGCTMREFLNPRASDDDGVLDFFAWKEGEEYADMFRDDRQSNVAATLAEWFREGLKPVTIGDVVQWLSEWNNPDEIAGSDEDLFDLVKTWKEQR